MRPNLKKLFETLFKDIPVVLSFQIFSLELSILPKVEQRMKVTYFVVVNIKHSINIWKRQQKSFNLYYNF